MFFRPEADTLAGINELSVEEILAALEEGRRVLVTTEFLGTEHEVTLR